MTDAQHRFEGSALDVPALVLHVKKGYEERAAHIEKTFGGLGVKFDWILDGDRSDMDEATVSRWFKDGMSKIDGETSCALKHLIAYRYIIDNGLPGALILEDDMFPYKRFAEGVNSCIAEAKRRGLEPGLISFEDSNLKFIPRSRRRKGQRVYPGNRDRFTGCYWVDREAAASMLDIAEKERIGVAVDLWHRQLLNEGRLNYYWSQPAYVTQGTHCGKFGSSINEGRAARVGYLQWSWRFKRAYKRLLYWFR